MKTLKVLIGLILLVLVYSFVIAQKNTQLKYPINEKDVAWADSVWKGTTLADLTSGEEIYTKSCNKCHGYKKPQSKKPEKWEKIIPRMAKKSKLSQADELLVLKFIITIGRIKDSKK
jgi:cytochrome c5